MTEVLPRPVSHVSYEVHDLGHAVDFWATTFGAGPFFVLEHVAFDEVRYLDEPAVLDHSAAFGQWGPVAVELQQIYDVQPGGLAAKVASRGPRVNHVAYISPDVAADSAQLEHEGMPRFLFAKLGPVEVTFHDAPMLGHAIEIHKESDHIHAFFDGIARAADGWDGRDLLRVGPPPH
jgi:hypothetical protein